MTTDVTWKLGDFTTALSGLLQAGVRQAGDAFDLDVLDEIAPDDGPARKAYLVLREGGPSRTPTWGGTAEVTQTYVVTVVGDSIQLVRKVRDRARSWLCEDAPAAQAGAAGLRIIGGELRPDGAFDSVAGLVQWTESFELVLAVHTD